MRKDFSESIEMTILNTTLIFYSAPGYTLEQLLSITDQELKQLSQLEIILKQHQIMNKTRQLNEFAHYCQTASDRVLFRIMSHSKPLKTFLSESIYQPLWHHRLRKQGVLAQMDDTILPSQQWESMFLTTHYAPWKNSRYADHLMVQPLKKKIEEAIHSNITNNLPRPICI